MPRLGRWSKLTIRVIGTVTLIGVMFSFIPVSEVVTALSQVNPVYLALAFALNLAVAGFEAFQLWLLLDRVGMPVGLWRVFETKYVTRFYGQFLPSEFMASVVKIHLLAGPTRRWGEVVAALAFSRLVNTALLLLIGIVFWAIEMPEGPGRWIGLIMIGMAAGLYLVHLLLNSRVLDEHAYRVLNLPVFARFKGRLVVKVQELTRTMAEGYLRFDKMMLPIGALALVRHGLGLVGFLCIALALDIHLSILTIGWIRVVLQGLMLLPIHLSGIGVREGSLVLLLQQYSVSAGDAVALAFLQFAISLGTNCLGGLFELKNALWRRDQPVLAKGGSE